MLEQGAQDSYRHVAAVLSLDATHPSSHDHVWTLFHVPKSPGTVTVQSHSLTSCDLQVDEHGRLWMIEKSHCSVK